MIYSWARNLKTTPEQVLFDISYKNLLLYSAATPQFDDEKDTWDKTKDANNPDNFGNANNDFTNNNDDEEELNNEDNEEENEVFMKTF